MKLIAWSIIFLLFVNGFYKLFKYVEKKRSIFNTYEKLVQIADDRQKYEEMLMKSTGNREKVDILTQLDILIFQSGVKRKLPFLTAEIYIGFAALLGTFCFFAVWKLTGVFLFSVIGGGMGAGSTYLFMQIRSNENAKCIEEDMNVFLDLVNTYSKTSDDIIDILGKIYPSLHEPLSTYIEEFYYEAINTDAETAFLHLKYKLPHEKMKEVLNNLEVSSNQLTDYSNIANDLQEQLRVYLEGKREREYARKNGGMELLVFYIVVGISLLLLSAFVEQNVFIWLWNNTLGQCFIGYFVVLALYGLGLTFSFDKG